MNLEKKNLTSESFSLLPVLCLVKGSRLDASLNTVFICSPTSPSSLGLRHCTKKIYFYPKFCLGKFIFGKIDSKKIKTLFKQILYVDFLEN